ncbi:MAG: heparinase II/III family protein [Rhizobiales bacterium]|nr:heparinase II/III family protein [Hyphomicrobiales bacterium]
MANGGGHSPRLWALVARNIWQQTRRRLRSGPGYRWRYAGRTPERVLIAPPDLRLADARIAAEIYHGRYPLAGQLVESGGESPFQLPVANRGWQRSLYGFRWLRHMRAAGSDLASANARSLVADWIALQGWRMTGPAWEVDTTAKRVIAWLQHSSVVLQGADFRFYRSFLRSLAVQIRYLRSVAGEAPIGRDRMRARIALAYAALALPAPVSALRQASRQLAEELERQILPDGGHVSRNPLVIVELLADLLPLRQTYANQAEMPPPELVGAVERMLPALRFFRLGDGSLARFNGMGATIQERIAAILRHDDTAGAPLTQAPHSGYQRLALGTAVVIADTGVAPPVDVSIRAHAGCLSFEMSSGRQAIVVNSGVDTYGSADFRPLARATAAHSTATLNDTSSARFNLPPHFTRWTGSVLVDGPTKVHVQRTDRPGRQGFVASHDGYLARFGILHEREIVLSDEGRVLSGTDSFLGPRGSALPAGSGDGATVRFHLHPDVDLQWDGTGGPVLVVAKDRWRFHSPDVAPTVEDSIFFAALPGPRRTRHIALSFKPCEVSRVRWRFALED